MNVSSSMMRGAVGRASPLASALALTLFTGLASSASASYNPIVDLARTLPGAVSANTLMSSPAEGPAYYTIVFKDAPVATYDGSVAGIPAPGNVLRNGVITGKVDVKSPAAQAYVSHLQVQQQAFLDNLSATLNRPLDVMARMQHALNAVIVRLSNDEASAVMKRPDVLFIEREHLLELDTDRGPSFIGAPAIWGGMTATGVATKGEGILFGDIDSGINWESPAFAAVGPVDGYVHQNPLGAGNYLGQCAGAGVDAGRCNDKLIGIYNFAAPGTTGTDIEGHGSHTASTVAGNTWNATYASGPFTISGVAPHANVIAYLACPTTSCPSTATSQSANQAVVDGVDVINYSISGGTSPWTDATSTAFRNAVAAGAFVAASAGNTSTSVPNPQGQVNHMEPWVETVAASTEDRILAVSLDLTSEAVPPPNTQNIPMRPGGAPLPTQNLVDVPLIKSPNFANGSTDGCTAYPANTFVRSGPPTDRIFFDGFDSDPPPDISTGAVAVLHLDGTASSCGSGTRRANAVAAGAVGVIFVDAVYLNLGANLTSWSMLFSDWNNLEAGSNPATATVSIDIAAQAFPGPGDQIASFSFRGPRLVSGQGMVKPDITAPGVDILAVGASSLVGPNGVILLNGTSMSSPHMAGSAVLMRALNPTWSATQVKSALNLSSNNFGAVNQDGTPVRLWDYGSGRVNLASASKVGLIMDETSANFLAANPATGGDISSLNLASMAKTNFVGDTTFTRTVRRARTGSQTYTLSVAGFPAGAVEFSPASFTVTASGSKTFTVTAHGGLLTPAQWNLGELIMTPAGGDEPTLHLPIAVSPAGPAIAVAPTSISASSDTSVSNNLTISNIGNPTLNWTVQNTGTAQVTPLNTTTSGSGQLGGFYIGVSEGNYWSQNFDINGTTAVSTLRANGFVIPSGNLTTANTPSVTFSIYADSAGVPAGAPEGFGGPPLWTYTNTIGTAATTGITGTGGAVHLVLSAPGVPPLNLPSGRYWLTVYPSMNGSGAGTTANPLWAWRTSPDAQIGNPPVLYAPYDDPNNFQTDPGTLNMSAFVQGTVNCTLPTWVGLTTTSGSLGLAGSQVIPVVFDATGLGAGTYTATLCISSNATNVAVVPVPLSFNVPNGGPMPPTLSKAFSPTSVQAGASSTLTVTLSNTGPGVSTLTTALTDTFPSGLVVAATPAAATTCPNGVVTANPGDGSVSLGSGAQIPAGPAGSCTVTVDVTAAAAADYANTIAAGLLQTDTGTNAGSADATLTVTPVPPCQTGNPIEVKASAATPGPTGYPTLKDAFDAVNAGTHQGVLTVDVCADSTEAASAVLNASGSGASVYSAATIKPAGGAARTISGSLAAPLVDLNGADNVTIDGLNTGGNSLTLSNTSAVSTAGTSTIRFIEGATGNTVTRTTILGSSIGAVSAATGNVLFSTSTVAGGNSNNSVSANNIGPAGTNLPTKGVTGLGTASPNANSNNVVDANNIFDYFSPTASVAGISIQGNNDLWTISNNKLYQTAARTFTGAGLRYAGITLSAATGAFTVSGNTIGFGDANGTGTTTISGSTNTFRGIDGASTSTSVVTSIQGNVISGINQTTATTGSSTTTNFIGIMAGSTDGLFDIGTVSGNRIGSLDGSSTIVVNSTAGSGSITGIYNFSFFPTNISNNQIGSITIQGAGTTNGFRGILINTSSSQLATFNNNTIANVTDTQVGSYGVYGMQTLSAPVNVIGNVVRNLTGNCNGATVCASGIVVSSGTSNQPNIIARNTIHSLSNTVTGGSSGAVYALDLALPTQANVVERNLVHSISVASTFTTYQIYGLIIRGTSPSTTTVKNNMIRLGFDAAGVAMTTPFSIVGIRDSAGTNVANSYYHNSVYIGGDNVGAAGSNTYALSSDTVTTARNFQNNIFWNARSNAVGGGIAHFAVRMGGTAANPPGLTSNFNDILATGTDGFTGLFNSVLLATLTDWQTATGQDANSFAANPQFIAPNGDAATVNLHISPVNPTPIEGTGLAIGSVTDDFDGEARSGLTPTDIGADAGNFVP